MMSFLSRNDHAGLLCALSCLYPQILCSESGTVPYIVSSAWPGACNMMDQMHMQYSPKTENPCPESKIPPRYSAPITWMCSSAVEVDSGRNTGQDFYILVPLSASGVVCQHNDLTQWVQSEGRGQLGE